MVVMHWRRRLGWRTSSWLDWRDMLAGRAKFVAVLGCRRLGTRGRTGAVRRAMFSHPEFKPPARRCADPPSVCVRRGGQGAERKSPEALPCCSRPAITASGGRLGAARQLEAVSSNLVEGFGAIDGSHDRRAIWSASATSAAPTFSSSLAGSAVVWSVPWVPGSLRTGGRLAVATLCGVAVCSPASILLVCATLWGASAGHRTIPPRPRPTVSLAILCTLLRTARRPVRS